MFCGQESVGNAEVSQARQVSSLKGLHLLGGGGCGGQGFPDIQPMESHPSPVLFESYGKSLFDSSILYSKVSVYK